LILTPDQIEDKKRGFTQDSGFQLPREWQIYFSLYSKWQKVESRSRSDWIQETWIHTRFWIPASAGM